MEAWREQYVAQAIAPILLPKARELIASHEARGHLTVIVTAANSFITTPIAGMYGVPHLLASDPEIVDGEFTGRIEGIPCFHEGKFIRLEAWLADRGQALPDFAESYFYGDSLTVIVTAANSFITTPIAGMYGVPHLLASDPEIVGGEFTGRIQGIPCFHEGKFIRLEAWLADRGQALPDFAESYFYGDSQSDVPLMERVTHPVVVGPDETLARLAQERNWPVISLR